MGGGSKSVTIGHKLYATVHMLWCAGAIDKVHEFIYGERSMYKGTIKASQQIVINAYNLFGGESADGGAGGRVHLMFGEPTQMQNQSLLEKHGATVPAYRGVYTTLFDDFYWSFTYPYLKPVWCRLENIDKLWNGVIWYPEKLKLKRLKGISADYLVNVVWNPPQVAAPATINYILQYRVEGETAWQDALTNTFSGGSLPIGGINNKQSNNQGPFSYNNFGLGNQVAFNQANQGRIPSGSATHKVVIMQDAYEWQIVKVSGDGDVVVQSVVDTAPTYQDVNPAHLLYLVNTDKDYGVNLPINRIDDASYRAAADILHAENFGISLDLNQYQSTQELKEELLRVIGGYEKHNLETGLLELHLMRPGNNTGLITLNTSNSELVEYKQMLATGDLINTVAVNYRDDDEADKVVFDFDTSLINQANAFDSNLSVTAGVNKATNNYLMVHSPALAKRIAARDLQAGATPLIKMTRTTNRIMWNTAEGEKIRVNDTDIGIDAIFRVAKIKPIEHGYGGYEVNLLQDIFSLDAVSYQIVNRLSTQYAPSIMLPAQELDMIESPYWFVYFALSAPEREALPPDFGFGISLVTRQVQGAISTAYTLESSLNNEDFIIEDEAEYSPTAKLAQAVTKTQTSFTINELIDFTTENFDEIGSMTAQLGDELVNLLTYTPGTFTVTVKRGVLDTVPKEHPVGTKFKIINSLSGVDDSARLVGDLVHYRVIPRGLGSVLPAEQAQSQSLIFNNRAQRPYPPAQFKINDDYYPANTVVGDINISWVQRNHLTQTVDLIGYDESNIPHVPGTTYTIRILDGATTIRTEAGLTASPFVYTAAMQLADGDLENPTIQLESVLNGLQSWDYQEHTFEKALLIPTLMITGATPVAESNNIIFTVTFSWPYPDQLDWDYQITYSGATNDDFGSMTLTDDVFEFDVNTIAVPSDTLSFNVVIPHLTDADAELGQSITLSIGGQSYTINLID